MLGYSRSWRQCKNKCLQIYHNEFTSATYTIECQMLLYQPLVGCRRLPLLRPPFSRTTLSFTAMRDFMASRQNSQDFKAKVAGALYCEVDAEPLERYWKGGYHPTHLGETLKEGRYKILHKLGWGGYATVWLARDLM